MKTIKLLRGKINEIVLKAYVKWTILMWEVEFLMNEMLADIKKYAKIRK